VPGCLHLGKDNSLTAMLACLQTLTRNGNWIVPNRDLIPLLGSSIVVHSFVYGLPARYVLKENTFNFWSWN
jgi:hypothetical protein